MRANVMGANFMKLAKLFVGAVGLLGTALSVQAATFTMVPVITRSSDLAGSNVVANPDVTTNPGVARLYEISLFYTFAGNAANEASFGGITIDANNAVGLTRVPANAGVARANFSALNPNSWTDTFGDAHPIYSTLGDLGTSTDFVNITGSVDPVGVPFGDANDPRPTLGKVPGGSKLGAVWYQWNGTSPATVLIDATSGGFV